MRLLERRWEACGVRLRTWDGAWCRRLLLAAHRGWQAGPRAWALVPSGSRGFGVEAACVSAQDGPPSWQSRQAPYRASLITAPGSKTMQASGLSGIARTAAEVTGAVLLLSAGGYKACGRGKASHACSVLSAVPDDCWPAASCSCPQCLTTAGLLHAAG